MQVLAILLCGNWLVVDDLEIEQMRDAGSSCLGGGGGWIQSVLQILVGGVHPGDHGVLASPA